MVNYGAFQATIGISPALWYILCGESLIHGWWQNNPSEKYESQLGLFQTTN
jgi:hypothetical protein